MGARASKRAAPANDDVLRGGVLHLVFEFVGPGHALYASGVSKAWHESYEAVTDAAVHVFD
jgi:hypothetical protein